MSYARLSVVPELLTLYHDFRLHVVYVKNMCLTSIMISLARQFTPADVICGSTRISGPSLLVPAEPLDSATATANLVAESLDSATATANLVPESLDSATATANLVAESLDSATATANLVAESLDSATATANLVPVSLDSATAIDSQPCG